MLHGLLSFDFIAVLNLFVILVGYATGAYWPAGQQPRGRDVLGIIILILAVLAAILDIFYIVLYLAGH